MDNKKFEKVVTEQFERCKSVLITKNEEYTPGESRLEYFNRAGMLQNLSSKAALWGMAAKHILSITDMCYSSKNYSVDRWNEKITDLMNYLFLLRGVVEEENSEGNEKV